jgi:CTP synthase (UTP-ammonia lyase)
MYKVTQQYEGKIEPQPSIEAFGLKVNLPESAQLNTILLLVLLVQTATNLFKTKPVEFAVDLLRGSDLQLLEDLDDIAVQLREITQADRVLIAGFHNGKKNSVYHWKRLSVLAEAVRLGIEPVKPKFKDLDTHSLLAKSDYDNFILLRSDKTFIHTHMDLPTVSMKQKRFMINCAMFGQYVMLLMDDELKLPHGIIFVQYDSREKCEVEAASLIGWSDATRNLAQDKAVIVNNLIYDRATSLQEKAINYVKNKLRF